MGRPRKPIQVKIAEGNRAKGPAPSVEQEVSLPVSPNCPKAPEHLSDLAKEEWEYMAPLIYDSDLLRIPDEKAFALYCEIYAQWRRCCEEHREEGYALTVINAKGHIAMNPLIKVFEKCNTQMLAFLTQFGLTPASRGKVTVFNKDNKDPFEEFQKEREGMRGQLRQIAGAVKAA
jgi:P27 family predicted phage terminase small subunit